MGQVAEFNWALKLKPEQGLKENEIEEGNVFKFKKKGCLQKNRRETVDIITKIKNDDFSKLS